MYEELIKALRNCDYPESYYYCGHGCNLSDGGITCGQTPLLHKAADAIEVLDMKLQGANAAIAGMQREIERMVIDSVNSKPKWIPVTERLPEKRQIVVVIGEKGTWDYGMFNGLRHADNPECWNWKKNTLKHVKWWMPKDGALPEPPKVGT